MKIRTLPAVLAVVILGFTGAVIAAKANKPPEPPRPGVEQSDHGREHVDSKKYGGDQPPTSGAHANPVSWGVYDTEVRDDQLIHNMEHGGIYISYQPSLPKEQVEKLKELLSAPFSDRMICVSPTFSISPPLGDKTVMDFSSSTNRNVERT